MDNPELTIAWRCWQLFGETISNQFLKPELIGVDPVTQFNYNELLSFRVVRNEGREWPSGYSSQDMDCLMERVLEEMTLEVMVAALTARATKAFKENTRFCVRLDQVSWQLIFNSTCQREWLKKKEATKIVLWPAVKSNCLIGGRLAQGPLTQCGTIKCDRRSSD